MNEEENDMLRQTHEEVFGPKHAPERGLVKRQEKVENDIAPIVGAFKGAMWPLRIIAVGLVSALTGWLASVIRAFLGGGQ